MAEDSSEARLPRGLAVAEGSAVVDADWGVAGAR